jgi:6-phosphogluconolactonase
MAERVAELAAAAVRERGLFTFALSGGRAPLPLYRDLAGAFADRIPWADVHLFWSDERCVPPDHPDSNFGAAFSTLISRVPIPRHHVHRMLGEVDPPSAAAVAYEETLAGFFRPYASARAAGVAPGPTFDLALLGVGPDGHTASLFPGHPSLDERARWAVAVPPAPVPPPVPRLTLTPLALDRARRVFFLATGAEKRDIVFRVLAEPSDRARRYPAARIRAREELVWFLDRAAASALPAAPRPQPETGPARAAEEGIG